MDTPVILSASGLTVHFGPQVVLDCASISIHEGDRIGLVGRNGAGKSTFLKIISGILTPDEGEVAKRKDITIGYLSQDFTLDETKSVRENILDGAESIIALLNEYETIPHDSPKRHLLEHEIIRRDAWNLDNRLDTLITSLNAPEGSKCAGELSGGEKRRTALCKVLIGEPDILILDEPTNHLDTFSIEWIEDFLADYKGTCIFVTHDRYFLDRIADRIVELSNGNFYSHNGNYTDYLINKAERQALGEKEEQKRNNFLRRELEWVLKGPRARRTKAKSRLDNYERVLSQENKEIELDVELIIPEPEKLGNNILEFRNFSLDIGGRNLISNFDFIFEKGRKLGITGKNGCGKTSLLKCILGEVYSYTGEILTGEKTRFNYVDQARLILDANLSVADAISEGSEVVQFGNKTMPVWTYLRRFLFTDDRINTQVGRLSGGEKSRLTLASILKSGGNFLILDEPTNDLDLPTLRILEEALIRFEGNLILVSHDRFFLNRICNGILAFEDGVSLYFSEGNYDYYLEKKKARLTSISNQPEKLPKADTRTKPKKLSYKEAKELETIEENIINAEAEVEQIEKMFSDPDFYQKFAFQINDLKTELESKKEYAEQLYRRWEELENLNNR